VVLIQAERLKTLLNVHSYFSFGGGVSSPTQLALRAAELGYSHIALTDTAGVYGSVELYKAAEKHGLKPIVGATVPLLHAGETYPLVLLCSSRRGYKNLNELVTLAKTHEGSVTLSTLEAHCQDLHVLTGGRKGFPTQLLQGKQVREAQKLLDALKGIFRSKLWVQLYFDNYRDDRARMRLLRDFARESRVGVVAAPEVRYSDSDLFQLYDALTCGRLGITLDTPHKARPSNDCQSIPDALTLPILYPDAIQNTNDLAERLSFELNADRLTPPRAETPRDYSAQSYLESLCREALLEKYQGERFREARDRLEHELYTLQSLGFADFFLVVRETMRFCQSRGIVASGRGSAAGSLVCYLLGITEADPISNGLLFERFLHTGKRSTPDIDIDISSSRRPEVFAWVEERFQNAAMVCNKVTYHLSSAIQDLGRALGIPPELRNKLTDGLGRDFGGLRPHQAEEAKAVFDEVLKNAPVKKVLLGLLKKMEKGFVRHVMPHSGGWVLSRDPLSHYSPVERSSGGLPCLQYDKDDVETLGLMKFDFLALRILSVFEQSCETILARKNVRVDLRQIPHDPKVWKSIQDGDTMGVFQVESPGQVRLSVQLQPENEKDMKDQVGLFRPGPIQSQSVHPYTQRRLGKEAIIYPHPALQPILERSYGIILFQEQVMQIAKHFAGFDWEAADKFRKLVSTFEDEHEIRDERRKFIEGAVRKTGATREEAVHIFNLCAAFRGYGFAESHAWAFGIHAYRSAWLRYHYPVEYFASVLSEQPGMYGVSTFRQQLLAWGIGFNSLDINESTAHYRIEQDVKGECLRPSLCSVKGVTKEAAREIVIERLRGGKFVNLQDVIERTELPRDGLEALARGGAFDRFLERREALYEIGVLVQSRQPKQKRLFKPVETPAFPDLTVMKRTEWDYELKGLTEHAVHPVDLVRQELLGLGATPMIRLRHAQGFVRTAGLVVAKQKPPTANGFAFYLLEDGPERVQLVIPPALWEEKRITFRDARMLVAEGALQRERKAWTLKAEQVWEVNSPVKEQAYSAW
jgi:error-prone DNA polymerase